MICAPHPKFFWLKIEKSEMGGTCSAFGVEERRVQGFGGET